MINRNNNQRNNLLIGAAALAGLIGTLTSIFMPKRANKGWMEKAHTVASQMKDNIPAWGYHHQERLNKNLMIGSVAGGLIGMTTALLLAPKSGSDLIRDITETFQGTQHSVRKQVRSGVKKAARKASKSVSSEGSTRSKRKGSSVKRSAKRASASKKSSKRSSGKKRTGANASHGGEHSKSETKVEHAST